MITKLLQRCNYMKNCDIPNKKILTPKKSELFTQRVRKDFVKLSFSFNEKCKHDAPDKDTA